MTRRLWLGLGVLALGSGSAWWLQLDGRHFLDSDPEAFAALFAAPPARDSAVTRRELDELLAMQATRTAEQIAAARADRKTDIERLYPALGFNAKTAPPLPALHRLAQHVETDVRIYVRAAKDRFRRLRPYEIEPRLQPCIENVKGDLSYPSGHAAYGYAMAYLLAGLVPERRRELVSRGEEFARQRLVCGVHFPSDLQAGDRAARILLKAMSSVPGFQTELAGATIELRAALGLPASTRAPQ